MDSFSGSVSSPASSSSASNATTRWLGGSLGAPIAQAAQPTQQPISRSIRLQDFLTKINYLNSPNVDDEVQVSSLQDVANYIESVNTSPDFLAFQRQAYPIIFQFLSTQQKTFILEHKGNQKKKLCLEILSRFVFSDLRGKSTEIFQLLNDIVENDNEDNAILALKLVIDYQKKTWPFKMNVNLDQVCWFF